MRDITQMLTRHLAQYQTKCAHVKETVCTNPRGCVCRKWAEIWAHIDAVVPDEYRHFTIQDFTGEQAGKQVLDRKTVAAARESLVKYCWEGIAANEDYDKTWITKSALAKRRALGNNLIIYGSPFRQEIVAGGGARMFKKPLGRTMLAAIVMKEVIFQRVLGGHAADSYAWVPYTTLTNRLIDKAQGDGSHDDEVFLYQDCDWLVVDGLQVKANDPGRQFRASVLEKLFGERLENNLPSILVFQDDLAAHDDLTHDFGPSINSIINSRKTFRVALTDGKKR